MGGSFSSLLADIIMVEMEDEVIKKLIDNGTIKFYSRFVDDTLLLIKAKDVELVKAEFVNISRCKFITYCLLSESGSIYVLVNADGGFDPNRLYHLGR